MLLRTLTSRYLLLCAALFAIAPGCQDTIPDREANENAKSPTAPPNIVFVLADDLGYGDLGIYGSKVIKTPHLDELARSGVRFTQGYVSHPVCSPSRAGLLTGRYQQRHGWEFNPAGRDATSGLSLDEVTFADMLREAGYATGIVGKWHLGQQDLHHPMNRGFDEYFGILEGGSTFIDSSLPGVEHGSLGGEPAPTQRQNKVLRGFEEVQVDEYLTDVFTDEAVSFIERHGATEKPFLLYLSHTTPHAPLQATAKYLEAYRHIEDDRTRVYAAMVASLDESVRRVVEALKARGILDNTLLVFASDNGCADYVRGACSNAPLSGYKRYHHEGGVRVPFVISWPAQIEAGQIFEHPVTSLDLFSTFAAAAGHDAGADDSVDLLPFLTQATTGPPHEYLYWRSGPTLAIRDTRYKLIQLNKTPFTATDLRRDGRLEPPAGGWPTTSPHGQLTLLYDLQSDPGETTNIAAPNPALVERLEQEVRAWSEQLPKDPINPAIRSTLAEIDGEWVQLIF